MRPDRAKSTPVKLNVQCETNSVAPYFVEELRQYLEKKYGSHKVHEAGLRVYTSLNLELQKAANRAVLDGLRQDSRAPPRMEGRAEERGPGRPGPEDLPASRLERAAGAGKLRARAGHRESPTALGHAEDRPLIAP